MIFVPFYDLMFIFILLISMYSSYIGDFNETIIFLFKPDFSSITPEVVISAMGQAFFSKELMKKFNPKSIRTVAICGKDDSVMRELSEEFGIEVVVYDD